MSIPGNHSFVIVRGADFEQLFRKKSGETGDPIPLTGLKVRAQFRTMEGATGTSTSTTLLVNLANDAGIAISDADEGEITLNLTKAQTTLLCPENVKTKVAYGIELYNDGVDPETVQPFLQGVVTLLPEVVR